MAVYLDLIDKCPQTNTELVKWIMKFPYPLYPREYIFTRRYCVDPKDKLLILVSRSLPKLSNIPESSSHAKSKPHNNANLTFQQQKNFVRVTNYKSNIIVMPTEEFEKPGLIYLIQYYDVNKAKIPKIAYSWMAASGLPDYIKKVHKATIKLRNRTNRNSENEKAMKKNVSNLNDNLKKYDQIDLILMRKRFNKDMNDNAQIMPISQQDETLKIEINQSKEPKDSQQTLIEPIQTISSDHDTNINNEAVKPKYFVLVIEKLNEDFFENEDKPHPLFYN